MQREETMWALRSLVFLSFQLCCWLSYASATAGHQVGLAHDWQHAEWSPDASFALHREALSKLGHFDGTVHGHLMTSDINYRNTPVVRPTPLPMNESLSAFPPPAKTSIVIFTMGSRGDVVPYLPLCKSINAIGVKCILISHEPYRAMVEAEGLHFEGVPDTIEDLQEEMDVVANHGMSSTKLFFYSRSHRFLNRFTSILRSLTDFCIQHQPAVIYTVAWTWAAVDLERLFNRPVVLLQPQPFTPTSSFSHCYVEDKLKAMADLLPQSLRPTLYDYGNQFTIATVLNHASRALSAWRADYPALMRLKREDERRNLLQTPAIYGFSPALVPRPKDYPDHVHMVGSWQPKIGERRPSGKNHEELVLYKNTMHFIEEAKSQGHRIVFIGFGSMLPRDVDHYEHMIARVADLPGVSVIYQRPGNGIGNVIQEKRQSWWPWSHSPTPTQLTDNKRVFVLKGPLQHHYFFDQLDAAVIHGGAGIIATSVRNAVPVVVKPFFGDQFLWCQMVVQEKWGACLNRHFTATEVANAVLKVLDDPAYKAAAVEKAALVAKEDGFAGFMTSSSIEIKNWVQGKNSTKAEDIVVGDVLMRLAATMQNGALAKPYAHELF